MRLGTENFPNSHHYVLNYSWKVKNSTNTVIWGYRMKASDEIVNYYKEQMLNDKPSLPFEPVH
jgi:hypothetical protein